ncbi:prepilin-type N-terminal cleavage/methylation domain-containing protein [Candidatus Kaiserbacteria bacterium]|nr:prepilin-type N-terminal cleavage/methylation domain-containing protein [Candidatus Kaiserbacteria bacterium]
MAGRRVRVCGADSEYMTLHIESRRQKAGKHTGLLSSWLLLPVANGRTGFTLIELLATMGIMTLISGMILANHNMFGGNVLLQNLAYDVALTIREAQVYGISVRRFGTGTESFQSGYGVHFETGNNAGTFLIFADTSDDGIYGSGELLRTITMKSGYHIQQLCTTNGSGTQFCGNTSLDILFKRPEPDAWIGANTVTCCYASAKIVVASQRGDTMSVEVYANGQISIQQTITKP